MNTVNSRILNQPLPRVSGTWTRICGFLACLLTLFSTATRGTCSVLYTVENNTSTLYTIDTATLATTPVGPLGVTFNYGDLAWDPTTQTLYMVDGRAAQALYTVNTSTGAATLVGRHNIGDLFGLAYDTATATLYGAAFVGNGQLYQLDTATGAATAIGSGIGNRIGAMAYNPTANQLLALNDCLGCASLYLVDPATGAGTSLAVGLDTDNSGMTYDPSLNRYWDVDVDGRLSYFDPSNGYHQVQVAQLNGSFDGLAFAAAASTNGTPTVTCPPATVAECAAPAELTAQVSDPQGDALTVVWSVNATAVQTNHVPAGAPGTPVNVPLSGMFALGTNVVALDVTDGANAASCSTTVTVRDTTPPTLSNVAASPAALWPPNHKMVRVIVHASASDLCSQATWRIVGVLSNEATKGRGDGNTSPDWTITDDDTVFLRAERSGGDTRVYSIQVQATDAFGNQSEIQTVAVTVPSSLGRK